MDTTEILSNLRLIANSLNVRVISEAVLDNPYFAKCSGSSNPIHHHYGTGGLIRHTNEVIDLCLINNKYNSSVGNGERAIPEDQLFLAALFHDVGKIWDYSYNSKDYTYPWGPTDHKNKIHHISRSALVWNDAVTKYGYYHKDKVLHAILAHHGCRAWGSPVEPQTRLAWTLHLCDNLSAKIDMCKE